MKREIATGTEDFKEIIETNSLYIDKTLFIKEIIDDTSKTVCFPRPRRFGKTLNMSMLNYYFNLDYKDNKLFYGLNISELGEKYKEEANKYPVISISFRELKADNYKDFLKSYKELMANLFSNYEYLLKSKAINSNAKRKINKFINEKENDGNRLANAVSNLVRYLRKYYDIKVIVLLDEYDAPILHAYEKGFYEEVITFMKQLFVTTFKDNTDLRKGVITGISRISKENLFSDANNIEVYNMTDSRYSTYFGFTESEVQDALKEYDLLDTFDNVKKWYDGYLFNKTIIYNPISILKYLKNEDHELITYWTNTGGVGLLKNLIYNAKDKTNLLTEFEDLINKGYKEHVDIDLNMDLKSLKGDPNTVWTLFMFSGYLTPREYAGNLKNVTLKIPNEEIKDNLTKMATSWFKDDFKGNTMVSYLINGTIDDFRNDLESIVLETFSYLDVPGTSASEAFYHAFAMGLLRVDNTYYEVTSNRESGFGRYDIILKPKVNNIPAYIIEFKLVEDDSNFEKTIEKAFEQIEEMKYEVSVKDYDKVIKMAIAFKGKKLRLETR